ncbi:MAG TPA: YraN family protein [Candidatus Xenobia bacterium]|jgi:putative endonuclease
MRLGPWGEQFAAQELTRRGYTLIATNYRNRFGEIDIIARHQGAVVFVEVKARRTTRFGGPKAAVTPTKRFRLRRMAGMWMAQNPQAASGYRFDVFCLQLGPDDQVQSVEVVTHAF